MWANPTAFESSRACVPLPQPGGPSKITNTGPRGFIDLLSSFSANIVH
jgi:hypothetical protein